MYIWSADSDIGRWVGSYWRGVVAISIRWRRWSRVIRSHSSGQNYLLWRLFVAITPPHPLDVSFPLFKSKSKTFWSTIMMNSTSDPHPLLHLAFVRYSWYMYVILPYYPPPPYRIYKDLFSYQHEADVISMYAPASASDETRLYHAYFLWTSEWKQWQTCWKTSNNL